MNTNMNGNYQQSPNQPHINYDAVDKLRMQQVQQTMDSNKFGKANPRRKGKNDWLTFVIAIGVIALIVLAVFFLL
ncbi:MAG: hypothetical protein E7430_10295 [Ruminococcaceae bacterium]|nr:hypothetical protein [Oscillospiraceae bacterium]